MTNHDRVAEIVYEALRALAIACGRVGAEHWKDADDEQHLVALAMVGVVAAGRATTPRAFHDAWCEGRREAGWQTGAIYDAALKFSPYLVPFDALDYDARVSETFAFELTVALLAMPEPAAGVGASHDWDTPPAPPEVPV